MSWWEKLAYEIARGITRAVLDVYRERETFRTESGSSSDSDIGARMRDAVTRVQAAGKPGDSGRSDTAPNKP